MSSTTKRGFLGLGLPAKLGLALVLFAAWFLTGPGSRAEPAALQAATVGAAPAVQEAAAQAEALPQAEAAQDEAADEAHGAEEEHAAGAEHLGPSDFFLILIAILVFAKIFGELAERIGQPSVLGELIAGLVLGGSVLGIVPTGAEAGADLIHLLAEVGVAILLFEIGLETDLKEMFRVGASSASVAIVGVALPFLLGFAYWFFADPSIGAHLEGVSLGMIAVFVGATLTATSVGITARVLTDLKLMHRPESRIIIGAAVIDDVLGLVILAVVSGLAAGAALSFVGIATTFTIAVGFLVAAVIVGNALAPRLFTLVDRMRVRGVLLVSAFSFALLFAALADKAGSAMIIGSFAAGIVLSSTNQFDLIVERIEPVADIFTPIFFVSVGAAVNVQLFLPWSEVFNAQVIIVGGILVAVAVVGKLLAGFVVGWGTQKLNRMAIGVGMVPRGEVGLIFADIGRRAGLLTPETFSAILIMVIVTTFIAPPLLKIFFKPGEGDQGAAQPAPSHGGGHH
ncbi:MAG TPA: cation:proton antiporter [Longimicrobiales bacterium]|nr:cation:proton antiporter [Longimicrobiales bacterium]